LVERKFEQIQKVSSYSRKQLMNEFLVRWGTFNYVASRISGKNPPEPTVSFPTECVCYTVYSADREAAKGLCH
jgi:hypothetical protein